MFNSFTLAALYGCASATYFYSCQEVAFCQRFRDFEAVQLGKQQKQQVIPPRKRNDHSV